MRWRRLAVDALAVASETGWLYAAGILIEAVSAGDSGPSYGALLAAAGVSLMLVRLGTRVDASRRSLTLAFVVVSVLALYAITRLEFAGEARLHDLTWLRDLVLAPAALMEGRQAVPIGVLMLLGTWLRNAYRAASPITFDAVVRSFSAGFAVLVLAAAFAGELEEGERVTGLLLPVFAGYLLAMAIAQSLQAEVDSPGARRGAWFGALAVTVLVVAGAAAAVGVITHSDFTGVLQPTGEVLRAVLAAVVFLISLPLFLLISGAFRAVLMLTGGSEEQFARNFESIGANLRNVLAQPETVEGGPDEWLIALTRSLQLALFVAITGLLLFWFYRRLRQRRGGGEEERESLFSTGALRRDLRGLLRGLAPGRARRAARPAPASGIGRLYRAVLDEAARRGVHRDPALTPTQFAGELFVLFGSRVPVEITAAFVARAYGCIEPAEERVRELRASWTEAVASAAPP